MPLPALKPIFGEIYMIRKVTLIEKEVLFKEKIYEVNKMVTCIVIRGLENWIKVKTNKSRNNNQYKNNIFLYNLKGVRHTMAMAHSR